MFWKGCADLLLNRRHVAALGIEELSYDGFPTERTPVAIACRLKAVQNTTSTCNGNGYGSCPAVARTSGLM